MMERLSRHSTSLTRAPPAHCLPGLHASGAAAGPARGIRPQWALFLRGHLPDHRTRHRVQVGVWGDGSSGGLYLGLSARNAVMVVAWTVQALGVSQPSVRNLSATQSVCYASPPDCWPASSSNQVYGREAAVLRGAARGGGEEGAGRRRADARHCGAADQLPHTQVWGVALWSVGKKERKAPWAWIEGASWVLSPEGTSQPLCTVERSGYVEVCIGRHGPQTSLAHTRERAH